MTPLQRVPTFQLMLSGEQFRAIGHVAMQWSFLEYEIDREIVWLNEGSDDPVNLGAKFEDRSEGWLRLATFAYVDQPKLAEAVSAMSKKAVKLKSERDKLVHGNVSSSGTLLRVRKGKIIDGFDTGTPAQIEDLACRIADISAALFRHQHAVSQIFDAPL